MDYSELEGGLVRLLNRLKEQGTATGDPEADQFLRENGNAALIGLLFDQRVRAEGAFTGPLRLKQRLGHLDMKRIAAMEPEDLRAVFAERPAIHRFTNVMADRLRELAQVLASKYEGDASNIWTGETDLRAIEERVGELPGFGTLKVRKIKYVLHYFGHRTFS